MFYSRSRNQPCELAKWCDRIERGSPKPGRSGHHVGRRKKERDSGTAAEECERERACRVATQHRIEWQTDPARRRSLAAQRGILYVFSDTHGGSDHCVF